MTTLTLRIREHLEDRILVSRESARELEKVIGLHASGIAGDQMARDTLVLDFAGVSGMAPSFLDELLLILESALEAEAAVPLESIVVAHPPTRLSLKFQAVARGHSLSVQQASDGSWVLTRGACETAAGRAAGTI